MSNHVSTSVSSQAKSRERNKTSFPLRVCFQNVPSYLLLLIANRYMQRHDNTEMMVLGERKSQIIQA